MTEKRKKRSKREIRVEICKNHLQYSVGLYIFFFILLKMYVFIGSPLIDVAEISFPPINHVLKTNILALISQAMMVSAAIELAYMLFTPGPDEAVDPLILGIAGTALLVLSDDNKTSSMEHSLSDSASIFLYVLSMFILFYLKHKIKFWFPKEFGEEDG